MRTMIVVITRFSASPAIVRRLAFASLLANVGIVLTGGAVRLTGSGLGCPTWPQCTDGSWTSTAEMGIHGTVEFGNRTLAWLVGAIALATLLAALALRPRRRSLVWLAAAVLAGIAVQGLIGGVIIRTDLNPSIVGTHFLVSVALIATAYTLWRRVDGPQSPAPPLRPRRTLRPRAMRPDGPARATVPAPLRTLAWLIAAVGAALLTVGTVVTGAGPHAGDPDVPRNGLDPQTVAQAHADLGFLLLGLAVAAWFALRAVGAEPRAVRAAAGLVAVILSQGLVGLVQYFAGLPELLVWLHLLGSCLVWLAVLQLLHATRARAPEAAPPIPAVDHGVLARHAGQPAHRTP